jgi:outer membrane protein assembly factor BamD (BamD/ComL family)
MKEKPKINRNAICISLCNLNCFGIGYLLAGLKKRWLIAFGINLVLLYGAYYFNASKQPLVWALVFSALFIAMVIDLGLQLKKNPELIKPVYADKKILLPILALAMILVFYGGFYAYRYYSNIVIEKGEQAYTENDFQNSFKYLYSATHLYRLSLNPQVVAETDRLNEVSTIVTAQSLADQAEFSDAVDTVNNFHKYFPDSEKTSFMNNLAVDVHLAWAGVALEKGINDVGEEHFVSILQDFPIEAAKRMTEIDEARAENFLAWGQDYDERTYYIQAIEKFEEVVDKYPDTSSYETAFESAANAHHEAAVSFTGKNMFDEAMEHLAIVQDKYAKSSVNQTIDTEMPEFLLNWGKKLSSQSAYLAAIEKFDEISDYTKEASWLNKADAAYEETLPLLAKDTGDDGKQVMRDAMSQACSESPVDDPVIDIFPEEQGKALACSSYDNYVPMELEPTYPGEFRYVVVGESADRRVQSCPYTGGRTLERWQYGEIVSIKLVKTGEEYLSKTFYGSSPIACPYTYWFSGIVDEEWGDYIDESKIEDWLTQVLK